jgi:tetratricopeptide (TPR) repeat protein
MKPSWPRQKAFRTWWKTCNALIDSIIARITLEESRTREQEMTTMQDQQFNRMALNESQRRSTSADQGGKWYFYNQAAKGFGQPEFRMKWGNRKLEDNWRRANKSQVKFENEESTEASDTSGALKEKTKILSNKSREYYLRDIPMTDSMMELSNAKIIEGLYNAGTIYKNELRDYPRAVETYRDLQDRFPGNGFTLSVYYNLYRIFNDQKDPTKADIYKQAIIREFPESQPAQLLANPNYVAELQAKENEVNDFYEQTYNMYQRGDYQGVITNADLAGEKFTGDPVIPKFEFLKVLSIGKTRSRMVFTRALDSLARTSPDPEIAERSSSILAYIMNTDKEVKTETEKIAAEEIYRYDTAGAFSYGLFVSGKVDINQLKFEFINLNLDLFPNRTFNVVNEELQGRVNSILVQRFKGMEQAWDYYDQVFRNEKIIQVLGDSDYKLFIISQGNEKILTTDKTPNKYWLFFQKYYHRNESD